MVPRYRSLIQDPSRWEHFDLRAGDIVISTPPKAGTTWTQVLVAMLVFAGPDLPDRLSTISPWIDQTIHPIDEVTARLDAQRHRRFVKTHTPLDGIPWHPDVAYVVVGRDPRDITVSWDHHMGNIDVWKVVEMRGAAVGNDDLDDLPELPPLRDDPAERFVDFLVYEGHNGIPNLQTVLHHYDDAWSRRVHDNVVLCHYADYLSDLPAELVRLATALDMPVSHDAAVRWCASASIEAMRARAVDVMPNADSIFVDAEQFFRRGGGGEWRAYVSDELLARYERRVAELVDPDVAAWAHGGRRAGIDPTPRD